MSEVAEVNAPASARAGFTIVELIVAVLILSIGVVGLAGTAAVVTKQMTYAKRETTAATIAERRLEQLQAVSCGNMSSSSATTEGMNVAWTVGSTNNNTKTVTITVTTGGSSSKTYTFGGYVQCR